MRRVPDRIFIAPRNSVTSNWAGKWFKTFDLHAMGHCYELCSHGLLWRIDQAAKNPRRQVAIHKDIILSSGTEMLVARFSTAAVDWIRGLDEISLTSREFLPLPTSQLQTPWQRRGVAAKNSLSQRLASSMVQSNHSEGHTTRFGEFCERGQEESGKERSQGRTT